MLTGRTDGARKVGLEDWRTGRTVDPCQGSGVGSWGCLILHIKDKGEGKEELNCAKR